jgi:hypothetical protein
MLTTEEREFYDVWFREECGYPATYATRLSDERGITYDHFTRLEPAHMEYWGGAGHWGEPWPPLPDDPNLPCPWDSREHMKLGSPNWAPSFIRSEHRSQIGVIGRVFSRQLSLVAPPDDHGS